MTIIAKYILIIYFVFLNLNLIFIKYINLVKVN
jgi:hypothetical protein